MTATTDPTLCSFRLVTAFAAMASGQVEALRTVAAESERHTRDTVLLALDAISTRVMLSSGQPLQKEDLVDVLKAMTGVEVDPVQLRTLVEQARQRVERRTRIKDPFAVMEQTVATLRKEAAANASNQTQAEE